MVSVIVPCFNGEKFIKRCISSILNQTYSNIELIFINDGSVDNTDQMIMEESKNIENKIVNFKYIKTLNKGPAAAINEGLKHITGKFLTLLDVDDVLFEESIELRRNFLIENLEYDIVRTNGYIVNENNINNIIKKFVDNDTEKEITNIFNDLLEGKTNNWAGSYMIRVEKLFEIYPQKEIYESRYGQNLQLLLPLAYKSKAGFIDKPLMKYIVQESSLSKNKNDFELEKRSMLGYKDIRINVLKLVCSNEELENYLNKIEILYARNLMNLAFCYKNKKIMNENYEILKYHKAINLEDKIIYYTLNNRNRAYILRLVKKILGK